MPRALAAWIRLAATSRTWRTLPAAPSTSALAMVCTESTTSRSGSHRLDLAEHRRQVGLGGEVQVAAHGADPLGPQPHLGGRLLGADVEHARARRGRPARPRRAAASTCRCRAPRRPGRPRRHQAAAEHAVELADPGWPRGGLAHVHLGDALGQPRAGGRGAGVTPAHRRRPRSTVPQARHSPQRPTHLAALQPHSPHRYAVARGHRVRSSRAPWPATLGASTDRRLAAQAGQASTGGHAPARPRWNGLARPECG